ncbi:hypothetical protein [Taibaiella helva]|uniref:hypothetical protein n=1 Tax=Taibaiella helva TaxID=2301235 RepID=UPI000E598C73|nr:hypothetical protein [Taibaiella helva]
MILFPDEQELISSNGHKVVLTSQRIHMNSQSWGYAYQVTLFLEDISSVTLRYKSNVAFIVVAILCFLCSVPALLYFDSDNSSFTASLVTGLVFLTLWWFSRKHLVSIHPHGGRPLEFEVDTISGLQLENFLHKLQWAKAQRINKLYRL